MKHTLTVTKRQTMLINSPNNVSHLGKYLPENLTHSRIQVRKSRNFRTCCPKIRRNSLRNSNIQPLNPRQDLSLQFMESFDSSSTIILFLSQKSRKQER